MKRKINIIVSTSAASVMALAALAQDQPHSTPEWANYTQDHMAHVRTERLNGAAKASDIIGMTVQNNSDEKLGKVEDLAVDVESGRIVEVILSTGGFLGIGDTLSAVPPGSLHHDATQKVLHLDADKAKLQGAPKFEDSKWEEGTQTMAVTEVYNYYGEYPYFVAYRDGVRNEVVATNEDARIISTLPRHLDGTVNTTASSSVETARNEEAVQNVAQAPNAQPTRNADGTWSRERNVTANRMNPAPAKLGYVQKASKLMGMTVKNQQNEKLGDVDSLMVDLSGGRIVAVIVSSGGFLGMGDELSAVPPTAFKPMPDKDSLQLDVTKEMLSNAPHFKSNQWPDFGQPSYVSGMYRSYHVEPYFNNDAMSDGDNTQRTVRNGDYRSTETAKADNSVRNVRDRNDQNLTPLDQGSSKADIATTAQIRKEVIDAKNLSVNAQNVKIITRNGQVTLRGPVNTADEKRRIGEIASRVARTGNVDNQLEVQVTTSSNN